MEAIRSRARWEQLRTLSTGFTSKYYGPMSIFTRMEVLMCDFDGHKCKGPHGDPKKEKSK
jgi:hypothetical protein